MSEWSKISNNHVLSLLPSNFLAYLALLYISPVWSFAALDFRCAWGCSAALQISSRHLNLDTLKMND